VANSVYILGAYVKCYTLFLLLLPSKNYFSVFIYSEEFSPMIG